MTIRRQRDYVNSYGEQTDRRLTFSPLNSPLQRRRVAIIGAEYSQKHAPLDDDTWDVWALNNVIPVDSAELVRADLWWEIHDLDVRDDDRWAFMDRLSQGGMPFITLDPRVQKRLGGRLLPVDAMVANGFRDYFANTFSYQIAYAIYAGYEEVGVFGAHLFTGSDRESTVEAACVSYWLGFAEAKGVKVHVPVVPWGLLQSMRYGDEQERIHIALYTAARKQAKQDEARTSAAHGLGLTDIFGR